MNQINPHKTVVEKLVSGAEDDSVFCQGQTAKLHKRTEVLQDDKQSGRPRKGSLMPPIPSARSSAPSRGSSTSQERDGFGLNSTTARNQPNNKESGLHVVGQTGYVDLNSRKKSNAEKLADTGYKLYTIADSNKLPKILKPEHKASNRSKRKKTSPIDDVMELKQWTEAGKDEETKESFYNRYGVDLRKQFNMEVTRPFTFSYFPKIYHETRNDRTKKNKNKTQRKILTSGKLSVNMS